MAETRDLLFRFLGDSKDLGRASRTAQGDLEGVNRKAAAGAPIFGNLKGAVGGFIAAVGVSTVANFAFDTAKLSEQANIAADSAEKVLGPALDTLHTRLEDTRGTLGLNIGELDTIVAKFGLLTDGMGLSDEAQAEFIGNLITTGGELAAFRGNIGEAPEAIDAFGAALRGEFDPLEQFGIKLSEAAIQERILELRAIPANAALSDQEIRIAALQSLIDEKAGAAIGSLAEAQDTLAGKTNEANVALEDARIALGAKLQGPMLAVLEFLLESIDAWERLANPDTFETTQLAQWLRDLDAGLGPIDEWVDGLLASFGSLFNLLGDVLEGIQNIGEEIGNALSGGPAPGPAPAPGHPGRPPSPRTYRGGAATGPLGIRQVPGPKGVPVDITAHGGEMIGNGLAGGPVMYVTINALDPRAAAKAVVEALQTWERGNGAIPITTRQP